MAVIHVITKVNGQIYRLEVEPHFTLLRILREKLGLTGTKEGCGTGECGACTVIMDGQAVNSCLVLAPQIDGREIITIEGLMKDGKMHPIQESFVEHGAIQCGYCSPGMIMAATSLLNENPHPSEQEIREAIAGNLCRCTGYVKIVKAIQAAADKLHGAAS